jgi:hypothetical protein
MSVAPVIANSAMRVSGVWIVKPRMRLKSVKPLLPPKAHRVAEKEQHRGERQRLRDDREVHALDARAEREIAEHVGEQPGHQHDEQHRVPELVGVPPVPGVFLPVEEDHEVRQVGLVLALAADLAHQVHAHSHSRRARRTAVPEAEDSRVAPDEIHRQRDDRVAHDLADQRHPVLREWNGLDGGTTRLNTGNTMNSTAANAPSAIQPRVP